MNALKRRVRQAVSPRIFGDLWTTLRGLFAYWLLRVARVLLCHGLHRHGADEVHRLAEVGLEEQVHVGELVDGEARLDGDGDRVGGLGYVVAAQELRCPSTRRVSGSQVRVAVTGVVVSMKSGR